MILHKLWKNEDKNFNLIAGGLIGILFGIVASTEPPSLNNSHPIMSYWFIVCLGFLVVTLFGALIGEFNNVLFSYSTVVSIIGALFRLSIAEQQVSLFYIIGGVFVVILLAEVMFWITKEPCPKTNVFWYTATMKSENIVEILLLESIITNVYYLIRDINFKVMFGYLIKICTFISIAGLIVLILYVWIRLNMLKYRGEDHGRRKNKHR